MSLQKPIALALFLLALSGCTTQPPQACPPSGSAGAADARPAGVALSTVAETVAGNYTACNGNAEQLKSLLELLRDYQVRTGQAGAAGKDP
jgi:hypothetical protein